jgi:ATP-binding cassette subfamily B protein
VQAFGREAGASRRFSDAVEETFQVSIGRMRVRAAMAAFVFGLFYGGITLVLWLGARAVQVDHTMTGGALAQFVILSVFAASAVGALGETFGDVQKAAGAMDRIDELLQAEPSIRAPAVPTPMPEPAQGEVVFEDVTFAYPGRPDMPALKDFRLRVRPGETVALVGPSGAGKTTVFRLLLRFYDPDTGAVRVDGVDLRDATMESLRKRVVVVPQEGFLFAGSLRDNVRVGRPEATDEEVETALRVLGLLERFCEFPDGLETEVRERGSRLSAGERQLVSIARAALADPSVLVLDEATSNLDPGTEHHVEQAMEKLMHGRTTIVVAHRLSTAARANRIGVVNGGRLAELGSHEELVAHGGHYAELYRTWSVHQAHPDVA